MQKVLKTYWLKNEWLIARWDENNSILYVRTLALTILVWSLLNKERRYSGDMVSSILFYVQGQFTDSVDVWKLMRLSMLYERSLWLEKKLTKVWSILFCGCKDIIYRTHDSTEWIKVESRAQMLRWCQRDESYQLGP